MKKSPNIMLNDTEVLRGKLTALDMVPADPKFLYHVKALFQTET